MGFLDEGLESFPIASQPRMYRSEFLTVKLILRFGSYDSKKKEKKIRILICQIAHLLLSIIFNNDLLHKT